MTLIHIDEKWPVKEPLHIIGFEYGGPYKVPLSLPKTVKHLKIKKTNFFDFINLPDNIVYLKMYTHDWVNSYHFIPKSVKMLKIKINKQYKGEIKAINIPSSLESLYIDQSLAHHVKIIAKENYYGEAKLKSQLKRLIISTNQDIFFSPNSLPTSLEELSLNSYTLSAFRDQIIPPSVKILKVSSHSKLIENNLPLNTTSLRLTCHYDFNFEDGEQTKNIVDLDLSCKSFRAKNLTSVRKLTINDYCLRENSIQSIYPFVEHLTINGFVYPAFKIPDTVKTIVFTEHVRPDLIIPNSVETLIQKAKYSISLPQVSNVKELTIGYYSNKKLLLLNKSDNNNNNNSSSNRNIHSNQNNNNIISNNNIYNSDNKFLFIWRMKYLKSKILDSLVNPSGKLDQTPIVFRNDSTLKYIYDLKQLNGLKKQKPDQTIRYRFSSQILATNKIPVNIIKLAEQPLYIYTGDKRPIPPKTEILVWKINSIVPMSFIPNGIVSIYFGSDFNQIILKDSIPNSVLSIYFGQNFDQDLKHICFPSNLQYLYFSDSFDKKIRPERIPSTLKHIGFKKIQDKPRQSLYHLNQTTIDHLYLQDCEDIDVPQNIKYLKLAENHSLIRVPKSNIKCVTYSSGRIFLEDSERNQSGKGPPQSKEKIHEKVNPKILLSLTIDDNHFIQPHLFDSLNIISMKFEEYNQILLPGCIPNTVQVVNFSPLSNYSQPFSKGIFPESVKTIVFSGRFNQTLTDLLPRSLTELSLGTDFNQPILKDFLPNSLKCLKLGSSFKQNLTHSPLPNSLTKLSFKKFYHQDLIDWIPPSVTHFEIGEIFSDEKVLFPIEKLSKTNITKLWMGSSLQIESPSLIPANIKDIRLCECIVVEPIPTTIESLQLDFNYPINLLIQ
ncbi:hypothetical protein CYY_004040 [Polysphondylium violaceum]|uniref:FNIP repeat-containing protein n=1 Tax=Polysphondylium violaceum TaxID=133409 RepID=A0A8J4PWT1_9MYCE|nr:hypothetical protein CYY_004040 [Polysphondylium violaceum]